MQDVVLKINLNTTYRRGLSEVITMENHEIKYLRNLLGEIDPDKYDFRLKWTKGKEVIGVFNLHSRNV